jgi:hypothetical protein
VVWSIWGYHILTDIATQHAVYDPDGLVAGWKERLSVYPPALKAAILAEHGQFIRYWKQDYHYGNKSRAATRFSAGLSARIAHSLSQILFALNDIYFRATAGTRVTSRISRPRPTISTSAWLPRFTRTRPAAARRSARALLALIRRGRGASCPL